MLKKLKSELFSNETQKLLKKAHVDKSHDFIHPKYIYQLSNLIILNKSKNQLLNFLHKSLNSTSLTLKIKSLTVLHSCLRVNFDQQACQLIMNQEDDHKQIQGVGKQQKELNLYINEHIINFYVLYMKKMCMHRQTFYFLKKYIAKSLQKTKNTESQQNVMNIQVVTHGFKILNLCNYLFQSLQMFNKMGRYFIQHQQIISMYIQILQDFDLFNSYISKSLQAILVKNLIKPQHYKKDLSMTDVKLSNTSPSKNKNVIPPLTTGKANKLMIQPDEQYIQQTKHFFVYMRQSQKVLDRLYQFFHIRYYYKIVRQMITIPSFITIKNNDYNRVQHKAKKIDKNLVQVNVNSKYNKLNNTFTFSNIKTQFNIQQNMNETLPQITYFQTQPNEAINNKKNFPGVTKYFIEE